MIVELGAVHPTIVTRPASVLLSPPCDTRALGRGCADPGAVDPAELLLRLDLRADAAEGEGPELLLADEAISEIEHRVSFVGQHYPIEVERSVARLRVDSWRDAPVYSFLTGLNVRYLWKVPADLGLGARLFERLTVPVLMAYWGGHAAHFGWPRDLGEEPAFRQALPLLTARMRERLNIRPDELRAQHKDIAVDAVAWRSLDDRPGQTVLLCQCSIGDDWSEKGVPIEKWTTLVNFAVTPTRGLAFPFVPDAVRALKEVDWLLLCAGVGVPFDRLRMAHLLAGGEIEAEVIAGMVEWTQALVANLPDGAAEGTQPAL